MRPHLLITLAVTFLTSLATAAQPDQTVDIFAWPLSSPKSQTLAKLSYNSTHATVKSYTAPKIPAGEEIVRVGFHHPGAGDKWSGVATSSENFSPGKEKKILLHVNTQGELYHIGFKTSGLGSSSKIGTGKDEMSVEVLQIQKGQGPHVNKPVVLNAEGRVDDKEPEKTFLQKYVRDEKRC